MRLKFPFVFLVIAVSLVLSACSSSITDTDDSNAFTINKGGTSTTSKGNVQASEPRATVIVSDYNIITLLPRDAIPAIDNPEFYDVIGADLEYADDEQVIGVVFNGEARAYSTGLLSSHEIVNDTVGGRKIAVTW